MSLTVCLLVGVTDCIVVVTVVVVVVVVVVEVLVNVVVVVVVVVVVELVVVNRSVQEILPTQNNEDRVEKLSFKPLRHVIFVKMHTSQKTCPLHYTYQIR